MKQVIISKKSILFIPFLFIVIVGFKIGLNYYNSTERMEDFVQKQAQTLNQFMLAHRDYYQKIYLNKTIALDEKTVVGLPAFSAYPISQTFSKQNHFNIKIQTVSNRARNEKNQADENEQKAIEFFNKNRDKKEYFAKEESYFQYATPLFIEQKCLTCHGKKEDAPKFISDKYENAYDYKVGELRGIVSIKVPKEKIGSYFTATFFQDVLFDMVMILVVLLVAFYLIKYFKDLAFRLEEEVEEKTQELSSNVAFLESYELAMDESSIISKANLKGEITYVNDNFCKISGYTKEEAIGKKHNFLRHPENPKEIYKEMWKTIQAKKVWKGILQNRGKEKDYWIDATILPILDENNNVVEYIAIRHEITQMIEQQRKLDNIANTDTLTGLGSRIKLHKDIQNCSQGCLAIINIDNFSQVNDFYGHQTGDEIIQKVANNLKKYRCNENNLLYHLQGDEYVIFNSSQKRDIFYENMEQLGKKLSQMEIELKGEKLTFNFAIAISFEAKEKLLATADMALKVAKREDKPFMVYSENISLNGEYENNIKWAKKIKKAIANDKIIPVFQPIVDNTTNNWGKYESLVRLEDDGKLISPYFFLNISKKTKHYITITKIMIEKSFEVFKEKEEEFSLNLTIEDILNSDLKSFIFMMLERYGLGSRVVFEIVESESIENFKEVIEFIDDVKQYGCKIAIDDFGTGYSNFEYLLKLKADYIKIDGSLIKDIDTNETSMIVVKNIVQFAKDLGIKTIAEFVENEAILEKIKELGVDYSQGYYFSEPKRKS